jgi:hypothetical protein
MHRLINSAAKWFRNQLTASGVSGTRPSAARLRLETLENREVLSVAYHGGPLLTNVQVETVFYGQAWYYNPTLYQSTGDLDTVLNDVTQSSYMDMLAEYGVGRGQFQDGVINLSDPPRGWVVDDTEIQAMLDGGINQGYLQPPSTNQLYVVYTAPNVLVTRQGSDSQNNFLGYHDSFIDPALGAVYYAVIAHPVGNADIPGMNWFQQQTAVTSHELSEAVTDPYQGTGWWENASGNEIGDFCTHYFGLLHGYVIQAEHLNSYDACAIPGDASWFNPGSSPQVRGGNDSASIVAEMSDPLVTSFSAATDVSVNDLSKGFSTEELAPTATASLSNQMGSDNDLASILVAMRRELPDKRDLAMRLLLADQVLLEGSSF